MLSAFRGLFELGIDPDFCLEVIEDRLQVVTQPRCFFSHTFPPTNQPRCFFSHTFPPTNQALLDSISSRSDRFRVVYYSLLLS
jgi:hypothetical protein